MRHISLIAATLIACVAMQAPCAPPAKPDGEALERLARANDAAWDAGDAPAIAHHYVADGTLRVGASSDVVSGRDAIRAYFTQAFARRSERLRHVTRLDHIEMVTPDLALSDALVRVERSDKDGAWSTVRTFRNTSIAVREAGIWKLHSVRALPLPAPTP